MTTAQQDTIDFTLMYATHDAFRRDLERLIAACAAGRADSAHARAGWENFKTQLLIHHSVEDSDLWPRVQRVVTEPRDQALLDAMEAEHARLDPLLVAVDAALDRLPGAPTELARELAVALGEHLTHEEDSGLPLVQALLTNADWREFAGQMRRRQGLRGAAVYVPWILDELPAAKRREFLAALPAPVRLINRLWWEPRYRRRNLWAH